MYKNAGCSEGELGKEVKTLPSHIEERRDDSPLRVLCPDFCIRGKWHTRLKQEATINKYYKNARSMNIKCTQKKKTLHIRIEEEISSSPFSHSSRGNTSQHHETSYLLTYRRKIPSKFLGANRPFTTSLCCPSSDPLVPNSASKKAITWSGCRCILKYWSR